VRRQDALHVKMQEPHMSEMEQAIRERAYHFWVAEGCRDGDADRHWLAAQRDVLANSLGSFARVTLSDADADLAASTKKPPRNKATSKPKAKRRAA
jgi:hypothetical protein